jgi:hypothetical protein
MTASTLVDLVRIQSATVGTGTITLGGAAPGGFRGTAALVNGATYSYCIQQGNDYEFGQGVYTASGTTFTRVPTASSNGNAAIVLFPGANVDFVVTAADLNAQIARAQAIVDQIDLGALDAAVASCQQDAIQTAMDAATASLGAATAQAWAESPTPPITGSKSAKSWAIIVEGYATDPGVVAIGADLTGPDTIGIVAGGIANVNLVGNDLALGGASLIGQAPAAAIAAAANAAIALSSATTATAQAAAVQAAIAAGAIQTFDSTTAALSNGVISYTITAAGTGGTNGSYSLAYAGGGGTGAAAKVLVSGGVLTSVTRQQKGNGYTSAPTISYTIAGLTGGAITAVIGANTVDGDWFTVPNAGQNQTDVYKNVAGSAVFQYSIASSTARPQIDYPRKAWTDTAGNIGMYLDSTSGRATLHGDQLDFHTLAISDRPGSSLPQSQISQWEWSVTDSNGNVRIGCRNGIFVAGGFELPNGAPVAGGGVALTFHNTPVSALTGRVGLGQSNQSGGAHSQPPLNTTQPYDNIMPNTIAGPTSFVPLVSDGTGTNGEYPLVQATNSLRARMLAESNVPISDDSGHILIAINAAVAGTSIEIEMNPAGGITANLNATMALMRSYCTLNNIKYCSIPAAHMQQGEANNSDTFSAYLTKFLANYDYFNNLIKVGLGQTNDIHLLTWQLDRNNPGDFGVGQAQTWAAENHPKIHMVHPKYASFYGVQTGHHDRIGEAYDGEVFSLFDKRIVMDGVDHQPMKVINTWMGSDGVSMIRQFSYFPIIDPAAPWKNGTQEIGNGFYATDSSGSLTVVSNTVLDSGLLRTVYNRAFSSHPIDNYGIQMLQRNDSGVTYGGDIRNNAGLSHSVTLNGITYPVHDWNICYYGREIFK